MPYEVDVVLFLGDRAGRPVPAARLRDQLEAGVDAAHIVGEVGAGDRRRDDVAVAQA